MWLTTRNFYFFLQVMFSWYIMIFLTTLFFTRDKNVVKFGLLWLTFQMAHFWTCFVGCITSFNWASDKLSHIWVRLFLTKLKIVTKMDRTHADKMQASDFYANYAFNKKFYFEKILKHEKITTFHQNQFLTCYLIFNFKITFCRISEKNQSFNFS